MASMTQASNERLAMMAAKLILQKHDVETLTDSQRSIVATAIALMHPELQLRESTFAPSSVPSTQYYFCRKCCHSLWSHVVHNFLNLECEEPG